ncbi:hypothetical protein JOB18_041904 [Solea senegalensis]|uniref:Uncharacterized protein n=1 Tax=Solea senegalensis TaxID=28829 RepID=A0AAV6SQR5_SOLSE|nr:hypothetical protein JOB18_041904 [Solea senegalensis]
MAGVHPPISVPHWATSNMRPAIGQGRQARHRIQLGRYTTTPTSKFLALRNLLEQNYTNILWRPLPSQASSVLMLIYGYLGECGCGSQPNLEHLCFAATEDKRPSLNAVGALWF